MAGENSKEAEATISKCEKSNGSKSKHNIMLLIILGIIAFVALNYVNDGGLTIFPEVEEEATIPVLDVANVELYIFNDLHGDNITNIEIWILNIGDETATNISVFARSRNQNGTILFNESVKMTTMILRSDESSSGHYSMQSHNTSKIFHTIEISWDDGRNSYFRETKISY